MVLGFEDFVDLFEERVPRKRLTNKKVWAIGLAILGLIAGDEQNRQPGAQYGDLRGHILAAHAGHDQVGNEQTEGPGVIATEPDCLGTIRRLEDLVTAAPEHTGHRPTHGGVIFGQENRFAAGRGYV